MHKLFKVIPLLLLCAISRLSRASQQDGLKLTLRDAVNLMMILERGELPADVAIV
jgi:hypothetical protein